MSRTPALDVETVAGEARRGGAGAGRGLEPVAAGKDGRATRLLAEQGVDVLVGELGERTAPLAVRTAALPRRHLVEDALEVAVGPPDPQAHRAQRGAVVEDDDEDGAPATIETWMWSCCPSWNSTENSRSSISLARPSVPPRCRR